MPTRGIPLRYSKNQVNRSGPTILRWAYGGPEEPSLEELEHAFEVFDNWRACHAYPLRKANMGLRSMCRTAGAPQRVTQRLKQEQTILLKLERNPGMQLSRMQDIAGCRAVVDTIDELRRVQSRVVRNRPEARIRDYIENPKDDGYRGVHVIVTYDGRRVEMQLRTRIQHEWAVAVERFSGRSGFNLKSGVGPDVVLEFFKAVSEAMALEEMGKPADAALVDRIDFLRPRALEFLPEGRR